MKISYMAAIAAVAKASACLHAFLPRQEDKNSSRLRKGLADAAVLSKALLQAQQSLQPLFFRVNGMNAAKALPKEQNKKAPAAAEPFDKVPEAIQDFWKGL